MAKKKKKYQWMHRVNEDGTKQNALFIDEELFDFEVDQTALAHVFESRDIHLIRAVQKDIENYFLESLSEFVGKEITKEDLEEAEKTGWI